MNACFPLCRLAGLCLVGLLPQLGAVTITPATPHIFLNTPGPADPINLDVISGSNLKTLFIAKSDGTTVNFGSDLLATMLPDGATITTTQFPYSANPFWLTVESDGLQGPLYPFVYLFNIGGVSFSPTNPLLLSGFWPEAGSVSRVALFVKSISVPDYSNIRYMLAIAIAGTILF